MEKVKFIEMKLDYRTDVTANKATKLLFIITGGTNLSLSIAIDGIETTIIPIGDALQTLQTNISHM